MPRSLSALTWNMPPTACQSRCLQVRTDLNGILSGMSELCDLHGKTGVGETGEYLDPSTDRQVGLGVLGLANLLRRAGVSYRDFGLALEDYINGVESDFTAAYELVKQIDEGIKASAAIARQNKMDRAFAIAPTASCSYQI